MRGAKAGTDRPAAIARHTIWPAEPLPTELWTVPYGNHKLDQERKDDRSPEKTVNIRTARDLSTSAKRLSISACSCAPNRTKSDFEARSRAFATSAAAAFALSSGTSARSSASSISVLITPIAGQSIPVVSYAVHVRAWRRMNGRVTATSRTTRGADCKFCGCAPKAAELASGALPSVWISNAGACTLALQAPNCDRTLA